MPRAGYNGRMPVLTTAANDVMVSRLRAIAQVTGVPPATVNNIAGFVLKACAESMHVHGLTVREIGTIMGVSHTTAERWISDHRRARGQAALREEVQLSDQDLRGKF